MYENLEFEIDSDIEENLFEPLYTGAKVTVCGAYCAIMHLKSTCRLPFSTVSQILELLLLLCPSDNKLPRSIYQLKKFFKRFGTEQVKTLYCSSCNVEISKPVPIHCVPVKNQTVIFKSIPYHSSRLFYLVSLQMKSNIQPILLCLCRTLV